MIGLIYAPRFVRQFKRLPKELQEETFQKIALFRNVKNHTVLKVHKLHGKFSNSYSFSINYKTRIVFEYVSKTEVALLSIGDHDVYNWKRFVNIASKSKERMMERAVTLAYE